MASFNALENFTVIMDANKKIICKKLVGDCRLYEWDSDNSGFKEIYNSYKTRLATQCTEIIGSNCDIYDEKNDTVIKAKTE